MISNSSKQTTLSLPNIPVGGAEGVIQLARQIFLIAMVTALAVPALFKVTQLLDGGVACAEFGAGFGLRDGGGRDGRCHDGNGGEDGRELHGDFV